MNTSQMNRTIATGISRRTPTAVGHEITVHFSEALKIQSGTYHLLFFGGELPVLIFESTHNQGNILAAKTETIAQNVTDAFFARFVRNVIQITFGIRDFVIDG